MSAWSDRSETISEVSAAFVAALGELTEVVKNKKAAAGKYEYGYADLASTFEQTRKVLGKHGLAITQSAGSDGQDAVIWTTVLHTSGEFLTAQPLRLPLGQTAQQTGSSITYGKRYALMAFLGLATEDDDGAEASKSARTGGNARKTVAPVRNDSRGQSVESRSTEEAEIRRIVVSLDAERQKVIREAFKDEFGSALSGLAVERHGEALKWIKAFA